MDTKEYMRLYRQARYEQDPDFWKKKYQKEKDRVEEKKKQLLLKIIQSSKPKIYPDAIVYKILQNFKIKIKNG
jgi:hypothetical protein